MATNRNLLFTSTSKDSLFYPPPVWRSNLPDTEQRILSAQIDLAVQNCRRGNEGLVGQRIGREHFVLLSHLEHNHVLVLRREVQLSVSAHRRSFEVVGLGQALLVIERRAGLGVEAGDGAVVCEHVI